MPDHYSVGNAERYRGVCSLGVVLAAGVITMWLLAPCSWSASTVLLDTGMTKCYDNESEIPCPSPGQDFYGQDGNYKRRQPSYRSNGNGTVTDQVTGLMWQQADDGVERTWYDAVAYCQDLELGGYTDWRLPAYRELLTIVDYLRDNPTIDPAFSCENRSFWSSSTYALNSDKAWCVNFVLGPSLSDDKDNTNNVRCVHDG